MEQEPAHIDGCPECGQPNTTLHWQERGGVWVCEPCAMDRRKEQDRLDARFTKIFQESFDARLIKTPQKPHKPRDPA